MNGEAINLAGARLITPTKFEFGEPQFRMVVEQVKKLAAHNGGALPVNDPVGVVALWLVMEKLGEISEKLAALEAQKPQ